MSTTVNYKGNTIATLSNETKTLTTAGTWVEADVVITDTSSGIVPSGTINIDDDGTYDVTNYASADVAIDYTSKVRAITFIANRNSSDTSSAKAVTFYQCFGTSLDFSNGIKTSSTTVLLPIGESTGSKTFYYPKNRPIIVIGTAAAIGNFDVIIDSSYGECVDVPHILGASSTNYTKAVYLKANAPDEFTVTINLNSQATYPSNLQAKTNINPTTSSQTITADSGYDGLSSVQINAMPTGTAGTPSASKGTVSNHQVSITPSVTNTTGYITGGTNTGTAVTVTASELASGNKEITSNGTNIDVVGYSTVSVAVPSSSAAIITDTTDTAGGTIRTITTTDEVYLQTKTITPTSSQQTVLPDTGYDGFSSVIVGASSGGGSGNVEIEIVSANLHDSSEDVANTYINGSAESSYNNWTSTGYIPVKSDTYYCVKNTPGNKYNAFYKSDKTSAKASVVVPESSTADDYVLIKTTSNTAYIRMSGASSGVANYEIYEVNIVSATAHTIYFEFSDSTNMSITAYYDNSFISDAITATTPTTYNNKTVTLAELDGVAWYEPTNIPLNTQLVDFTTITSNYNIDSNGELQAAQWYGATDYIMIDPTMTFSFKAHMWADSAFYDASKTFISAFSPYESGLSADPNDSNVGVGTIGGSGISIPSNAKFIRLSTLANPNDTICSLIRTA